MPYFESDPDAITWYQRALAHDVARVRLDAIALLSRVQCSLKAEWLFSAQRDPCPEVAAAAVLAEVVADRSLASPIDLFESDFASGVTSSDLMWEWEYEVIVAHGIALQGLSHRVWTADEDDALARRIALYKAYVGKPHEMCRATALIVDKRIVNQYTRSPRSRTEAMRWHRSGRPRYSEQ